MLPRKPCFKPHSQTLCFKVFMIAHLNFSTKSSHVGVPEIFIGIAKHSSAIIVQCVKNIADLDIWGNKRSHFHWVIWSDLFSSSIRISWSCNLEFVCRVKILPDPPNVINLSMMHEE